MYSLPDGVTSEIVAVVLLSRLCPPTAELNSVQLFLHDVREEVQNNGQGLDWMYCISGNFMSPIV